MPQDQLRVAVVADTFSPNMGYIGNLLPKYLARLGLDVHVVVSTLPHNYGMADFAAIYKDSVHRPHYPAGTVTTLDGYTLHVLPTQFTAGRLRLRGLSRKLMQLRPPVVQTLSLLGWSSLTAAAAKPALGFRLFTNSHTPKSVFPAARAPASPTDLLRHPTRSVPGRLVSLAMEKCYAPTSDCAEIAWRFFGAQRSKVEVLFLGTDTDYFFPLRDNGERERVRAELDVSTETTLCIYTGKLDASKHPLLFAEAIDRLRRGGLPFAALFVGQGPLAAELAERPGCRVLPFRPYHELAPLYRAADVAMWANESNSMLDAAACGLAMIMSDEVVYRDHIEGNGLVYQAQSVDSIVEQLVRLANPAERQVLGAIGAAKMAAQFSWTANAQRRKRDYEAALGR